MRRLVQLWAVLGCLLLTGCGSQGLADDHSNSGTRTGIAGLVRLGPQCPVEREFLPCGKKAASDVTVTATRQRPPGTHASPVLVAHTTTDTTGHFHLPLPPGDYVVIADAGMSCTPTRQRVASTYARVDIRCDTGIR
jgi:hypothetical protein